MYDKIHICENRITYKLRLIPTPAHTNDSANAMLHYARLYYFVMQDINIRNSSGDCHHPCLYLNYPCLYYADYDKTKNKLFPFDEKKIRIIFDQDIHTLAALSAKAKGDICDIGSYENRDKIDDELRIQCHWCGKEITIDRHKPRLQLYCSDRCRQYDDRFRLKYAEMLESANNEDIYNGLSGIVKSDIVKMGEEKMGRDFESLFDGWADFIKIDGDTHGISNEKLRKTLHILCLFHIIPRQTIMTILRGNCRYCGKPIPPEKPFNAQYCSPECSSKGRKLKYYYSKKEKDVKP